MEASRRPRPAAEISFQQFDDEILLFHRESGTGIWLNETASLVWLLCNGERTVVDIIELLRDAFPVAPESLPAEVEDVLCLLSGHGAIEVE